VVSAAGCVVEVVPVGRAAVVEAAGVGSASVTSVTGAGRLVGVGAGEAGVEADGEAVTEEPAGAAAQAADSTSSPMAADLTGGMEPAYAGQAVFTFQARSPPGILAG
jgi:hypothetical protein